MTFNHRLFQLASNEIIFLGMFKANFLYYYSWERSDLGVGIGKLLSKLGTSSREIPHLLLKLGTCTRENRQLKTNSRHTYEQK